ncbi:MAG: nitrate reductase [Bilophila wadsworthia]
MHRRDDLAAVVARTPRPPARRLGPRLHELERLADVDHPLDAAFSTCGWRENPLLTVANFVLHIGILLAVLFYSAHNVMWDYNFGFSLPSLPDGFMDAVTLATILACLVLGWRRLAVPASSYVTRQADWFSLLLVTGVMVTGFASAHGFGSESFMALLHVLFGEAILICLPFTRLSHAILIPFTRAYMGSESIGVRRTCDW